MSLPSRDDAIETLFPEFVSGYSWYEITSPPDPFISNKWAS